MLLILSPKHTTAKEFLQENIEDLVVAHQNIFETLRIYHTPKIPLSYVFG